MASLFSRNKYTRWMCDWKVLSFFLVFSFVGLLLLSYERDRYNLLSRSDLNKVNERLQTLAPQEKEDLACFFNYATLFCQYAYTLTGSKPMSICNFLQYSEDLSPLLQTNSQEPKYRALTGALYRGYQVWEKYQSLFPHKNYSLLRYPDPRSQGMIEIALINHGVCKAAIKNNLGDFCEVLGRECKAEDVLNILMHPNDPECLLIVYNERLLGILLGFGRNNACLFEQHKRDKLTFFSNEWPYWPRKWRLPGFMCDPSTDETGHLKDLYKKARKVIRWTYFGRNHLEVTLALLAKES